MRRVTRFVCSLLCLTLSSCAPLELPATPPPPQPETGPKASPSTWHLVTPPAADVPDLMVRTDQGYQVDPQWEVQAVDYLHTHTARQGDIVFDYQHIEKSAGGYQRRGALVQVADLQAVLAALQNFYPVQRPLGVAGQLQNLTRQIELVGQDGRRVLLFNTDYGANWNLVFNGRLYAQYNAKLQMALPQLFAVETELGQPYRTSTIQAPTPEKSYQVFYPSPVEGWTFGGWPLQLLEGFNGLLPIADGFFYEADAETQTLEIRIVLAPAAGNEWTSADEVGAIDYLEIAPLNQPLARCSAPEIQARSPEDAYYEDWVFTCPMLLGPPNAQTRYQVQATGTTRAGDKLLMTGELWGAGYDPNATPVVPLPEELAVALAADPAAQDLLTDHAPIFTDYVAVIKPAPQHATALLAGEMVLAGQTTWHGQPLRYTVETPFIWEQGQLRRWDLDRQKLQTLLANVLNSPLTQQVHASQPLHEISLMYADYQPTFTPSTAAVQQVFPEEWGYYEQLLSPCSNLPSGSYPNPTLSLQGFSYYPFNVFFYGLVSTQFLWIEDQPWPLYIRLHTDSSLTDVPITLLPSEYQVDGKPLFSEVTSDRSTWGEERPSIELILPEPPQADWATYETMARQLHTVIDEGNYASITATNFTLVVNTDGRFEVINCEPPS